METTDNEVLKFGNNGVLTYEERIQVVAMRLERDHPTIPKKDLVQTITNIALEFGISEIRIRMGTAKKEYIKDVLEYLKKSNKVALDGKSPRAKKEKKVKV